MISYPLHQKPQHRSHLFRAGAQQFISPNVPTLHRGYKCMRVYIMCMDLCCWWALKSGKLIKPNHLWDGRHWRVHSHKDTRRLEIIRHSKLELACHDDNDNGTQIYTFCQLQNGDKRIPQPIEIIIKAISLKRSAFIYHRTVALSHHQKRSNPRRIRFAAVTAVFIRLRVSQRAISSVPQCVRHPSAFNTKCSTTLNAYT